VLCQGDNCPDTFQLEPVLDGNDGIILNDEDALASQSEDISAVNRTQTAFQHTRALWHAFLMFPTFDLERARKIAPQSQWPNVRIRSRFPRFSSVIAIKAEPPRRGTGLIMVRALSAMIAGMANVEWEE
jgi:hypothetical protein